MIRTKRIYLPPQRADGYRVLVDRLWPRGLARETAALDEWLKHLAPSPALRVWFNHRTDRWDEFQALYRRELAAPELATDLRRLVALGGGGVVTLVFAARNERQNHAVVLAAVLRALNRRSQPQA